MNTEIYIYIHVFFLFIECLLLFNAYIIFYLYFVSDQKKCMCFIFTCYLQKLSNEIEYQNEVKLFFQFSNFSTKELQCLIEIFSKLVVSYINIYIIG